MSEKKNETKTKQKLTLNKETLRRLSSDDLAHVHGGRNDQSDTCGSDGGHARHEPTCTIVPPLGE